MQTFKKGEKIGKYVINSFIKKHLGNMRVLRIDKTSYGYHTFLSDASMVDFNYNGVAA